jgi:selenocysteine-specific elongation factor
VAVAAALELLAAAGSVVQPAPGRWIADDRWSEARHAIETAVRDYAEAHPARFGVLKGELKSALKARVEATLFDQAFASLVADAAIEQQGERVRPGGMPWSPPADMLAALAAAEAELEAAGFQVPDAPLWQGRLGPGATEIVALGFFLGRLVRVSQDLTYTAAQMAELRRRLAAWFGANYTLTVSQFRDVSGASRKFAVPLLEHCDRVGWTVRVGDERRKGRLE